MFNSVNCVNSVPIEHYWINLTIIERLFATLSTLTSISKQLFNCVNCVNCVQFEHYWFNLTTIDGQFLTLSTIIHFVQYHRLVVYKFPSSYCHGGESDTKMSNWSLFQNWTKKPLANFNFLGWRKGDVTIQIGKKWKFCIFTWILKPRKIDVFLNTHLWMK